MKLALVTRGDRFEIAGTGNVSSAGVLLIFIFFTLREGWTCERRAIVVGRRIRGEHMV
jgi:hypothetical protein